MNSDDHELVERVRRTNKTLSLFVFALQEDAVVSAENQLEIAEVLEGLARVIRARADRQGSVADFGRLVVDGEATQPRVLEPSRKPDLDLGP